MALCLALYARDERMRQIPMGIGETEEEYTEKFKAEIYDDIKRELAKATPDEWLDPDDIELLKGFDVIPSSISEYSRTHDKLLKEFGW